LCHCNPCSCLPCRPLRCCSPCRVRCRPCVSPCRVRCCSPRVICHSPLHYHC
jgi:hypothetical protein